MSVKGIGFTHKKFNFPCGEMHIQIAGETTQLEKGILFEFEKNEDIVELLLVADAMKRIGIPLKTLEISYVPFSRQDRVNVDGECFSLKVFADLVNSLEAEEVLVCDPHSDVVTALINNCRVLHQDEVFSGYFGPGSIRQSSNSVLVSPDGGALKKIFKLARKAQLPVIECSKQRNVLNGDITGVAVNSPDLGSKDCYIVDDICDGGRTFVEIAKVLKTKNCGKIVLMVTHGFFTKGIEVFDGLIDEIYTSRGRVK